MLGTKRIRGYPWHGLRALRPGEHRRIAAKLVESQGDWKREGNRGVWMITEETIREAVRRIVSAAHPTRVILFGSHARGEADEGSDMDLLVVVPEVPDKYAEMVRLRGAVGDIGAGVDVLVCSETELRERKDWCTSPVYWALREGKVLYEAA